MNEEKRIENKKSDKKALVIFIPCVIAAGIGGFFLSYFGFMVRDNWAELIANGVVKGLTAVTPYANLVINAAAIIVSCVNFSKVDKMIKSMDEDDDGEAYRKIDRKLSSILVVCNFVFILSYFFFGVGYECCILAGNFNAVELICYFLGFIVALVANLIISSSVVNTYKELNPEKQGSVFDFNFGKKWEKSCDEAERMQIYKAAYKSYTFCNVFYIFVWLACLIGNQIWDFGIMPSVIVIIVWLAQFICYEAYAAYYSKNPNKV